MKIPGPEHPITLEPNRNRVRVSIGGRTVADTTRALTLREATLPPVFYVPREDVQMAAFERTGHITHCPYKGDAAHYAIRIGDRVAENAAWSYEEPYPAMAQIAGRIAFYPRRVDSIEETAPETG